MPAEKWSYGYSTPAVVETEERRCFCVELPDLPEYRVAFYHSVMRLSKWRCWHQVPYGKAKQVADYLKQILLPQLGTEFMCNPLELRQNPDNLCLLEYRNSPTMEWQVAFDYSLCQMVGGGSTQVNFQLALEQSIAISIINRYDGSDITTINAYLTFDNYDNAGDAKGKAALCMALGSFVRGWSSTFARKARSQLGLIVEVGGPAAALLGPVGWVVGGLVIAAAAVFTLAAINAAEDEQAQNKVICCMNEALQGQAITEANFEAALDACGFTGGTNEAILRDLIAADLNQQGNWILSLDKLGDATPLAQADVVDCPCEDWCEFLDFTIGTQGFAAGGPTQGDWVDGVGWVHEDYADGIISASRLVSIGRSGLTAFTMTRISVHVTLTKGVYSAPGVPALLVDPENYPINLTIANTDVESGTVVLTPSQPEIDGVTGLAILVRSSHDANYPFSYSGAVTVTGVEICGTGTNPFA